MSTPKSSTQTMQQDTDENVLSNLQTLDTSVQITSYTSLGGKQVTFADTPSVDDISWTQWFFAIGLDQIIA